MRSMFVPAFFILLRQSTLPLAARVNGGENTSVAQRAKEGWLRKNFDTTPLACGFSFARSAEFWFN